MLSHLNKLASLGATLVRNYDPLTHSLTGGKCRATSVAKKLVHKKIGIVSQLLKVYHSRSIEGCIDLKFSSPTSTKLALCSLEQFTNWNQIKTRKTQFSLSHLQPLAIKVCNCVRLIWGQDSWKIWCFPKEAHATEMPGNIELWSIDSSSIIALILSRFGRIN